MNILVCIGNVPDTTTKVKFLGNELDKSGVQWIINPWDELSLTRAIELKDDSSNNVNSISVVHVGGQDSEPTIRKALAMGADEAYRIDTRAKDAFQVASLLANFVKDKDYDIVLTGLENSDFNGFAVGGMLAELAGLASVSAVSELKIDGDKISLKRSIPGGSESVAVDAPVVLSVQKGIAIDPKIPAMRGIMMARRKPLNIVEAEIVESLTEITEIEMPEPKGDCKMIDSDNVEELVSLLRNEAKVI
jgi:electron transfer flavoprotein beta subunit